MEETHPIDSPYSSFLGFDVVEFLFAGVGTDDFSLLHGESEFGPRAGSGVSDSLLLRPKHMLELGFVGSEKACVAYGGTEDIPMFFSSGTLEYQKESTYSQVQRRSYLYCTRCTSRIYMLIVWLIVT